MVQLLGLADMFIVRKRLGTSMLWTMWRSVILPCFSRTRSTPPLLLFPQARKYEALSPASTASLTLTIHPTLSLSVCCSSEALPGGVQSYQQPCGEFFQDSLSPRLSMPLIPHSVQQYIELLLEENKRALAVGKGAKQAKNPGCCF